MRFDVRYVVMCDANQQCWFNTNKQHSVCKFWSYYLTVLCCLLLEIYCILVFGYLWLCVYGRECECYSALSILSIRFMFRYFATFICFAIYFAMPCIAIVHQICLLWTRSHSHRIYLLAITLECISITCCDRKLCVWTSKNTQTTFNRIFFAINYRSRLQHFWPNSKYPLEVYIFLWNVYPLGRIRFCK